MDESNLPSRRPDLKSMGIGGGIAAALLALTPLNDYIDRSQKPMEVEIRAMKEVQTARLQTVQVQLTGLQATADDIKKMVQEQIRETQNVKLRVQSLEFIVNAKTRGK